MFLSLALWGRDPGDAKPQAEVGGRGGDQQFSSLPGQQRQHRQHRSCGPRPKDVAKGVGSDGSGGRVVGGGMEE